MKALAFLSIVGVSLFQFIPHDPNFSPLLSVVLFAGAFFGFVGAILAATVSLFFIGASWHSVLFLVIPIFFVQRSWLIGTIASSFVFFLLSNGIVFLEGFLYPKTWLGLYECYFYAIPFFKTQFLGALFYSLTLFEGHKLLSSFLRKDSQRVFLRS